MLLTSKELADLFCEADGGGEDARRIVLRRVRRFETEKLIHAAPEARDDRGTLEFDMTAACIARVLSRLTDLGFDRQLLSHVPLLIAPPASGTVIGNGGEVEVWDDPGREARHIKNIAAAIRADEDYILRLHWTLQHGRMGVSGSIVLPGHDATPEEIEAGRRFREFQGIRRIATLELSLTDLCRPVVEYYGN